MATANMNLTLPTEGGDSGTWDTILNTALTAIDAHDHSSGNGVQIPSAGIGIDADLSFADNSLTAIKAARFTSQAGSLASYTLGLATKSNELYWVTSGGTEVQLTSGTGLNTTLVGGFTGDYSTTDAECKYTSVDSIYGFYRDFDGDPAYGHVRCWRAYLVTDGIASDNTVGLLPPTALASSYDLTFPAALPSGTRLLTVSNTGAMSTSTTIPLASLPGSGDEVVTIDSTGQLKQGAEVSAFSVKSGEDITLQGAGELKHGQWILSIPAAAAISFLTSSHWDLSIGSGSTAIDAWLGPNAASEFVILPVCLLVGDQIRSLKVWVQDTSGSNTLTVRLRANDMTDYTTGGSDVGSVTSAGSGSIQALSISGLTTTIASGTSYSIAIESDTATCTTHKVLGAEVTYDRP